ncbi:hypothetical protein [Streptomyces sp. NPDC002467]|uniref:hypothetical protein n=1 Tax=Streptomyces sp. NPDC002467 TaxID=3364647 RepID=UPI0036C2F274
MDVNRGDSIWALMLVKHPSDTYLSQSSDPGGKSALARDEDKNLVTHAVLFDGDKAALGILGAGVVLGIAAVKAAPRVKSGLISLKSKLSRRAEETADTTVSVPLTVVAEVEPEQPDAPRLRVV